MTESKKKVKVVRVCALCKERETIINSLFHGRGICFQCAVGIISEITGEVSAINQKLQSMGKKASKKK